jgi:hypothetical protein
MTVNPARRTRERYSKGVIPYRREMRGKGLDERNNRRSGIHEPEGDQTSDGYTIQEHPSFVFTIA